MAEVVEDAVTDQAPTKAIAKPAKVADKSSGITALAKAKPGVADLQMSPQRFVDACIASKLFKDTADAAQAYIKITLGASLGLDPVTSMASIYIVQGKPSLSANLLAARVNQSGYARYEILEKTPEKCRIQFYRLIEEWTDTGKQVKRWVKPGPPEEYNVQMAKVAGLTRNPVWTSHPMNMNFARCMSNGVKTYFAELMNGVPIYTPDELDPNMPLVVTADGEVVPDAEYVVQQEPPKPKTGRSEEIRKLMADTKSDSGFLKHLFGTDDVGRLTEKDQDKAVQVLRSKLAASSA